MFLTYIREIHNSNLGEDVYSPDKFLVVFLCSSRKLSDYYLKLRNYPFYAF